MPENKPQVFFFSNISSRKGVANLIYGLTRDLTKAGNIYLVCCDADSADFSHLEDIIQRVNIFPLKRLLSLTPLRWDLKMMTFFEYNSFDYLASFYLKNASPVYALAGMALHIFKKAQRMGLKKILIATSLHIDYVWQLHKEEEKVVGADYEWLNLSLRDKILKEYELADQIIVHSDLTHNTFTDRGIPASKLKRLNQKVDRDYFRRKEAKKDDIFRIIYVGRMTPQKGIHYLISAFKELKLANAELLLFGLTPTSRLKKWLNTQISEFPGININQGDVRLAYEQASVLVHPSLNDNTGSTIFEALGYGIPVILTENTGAKELIKEGENGYIIPIRDVAAIKEKVLHYYNNLN